MKKNYRFIPILVLTILCVIVLPGCKSAESSSTAIKHYSPINASIDLYEIIDDKVKVEIRTESIDADTISYFLPKIVPGTYQNNNYGKYIESFEAFDKEGKSLSVQKVGHNQWKINNVRQLAKITYLVNDTFDIENAHEIFSPTGTNIDQDKNFILNLYAFVGYFSEMKETEYRLFIKHPVHLEASTSATEVEPGDSSENINFNVDYFIFNRYADVADTPIMYSVPDRVTFTANGIEILLSIYSPNKIHKASRFTEQMERMIRAQSNFLGNINTTKKYSILLYLSTTKPSDASGFGALEHDTSTVVVLPESLTRTKLTESLINVVSHEFFHIVTPLSIQSKEIHFFDYNQPKMSKHLWLYEGTTEYFSIIFQITQGLIGQEEFMEILLEKIEISKQFDDSWSFTEMSKNILKEPYRQNYRNVYEKGALISMCIDILMREKSDGLYGIVDLIHNLSQEYGSQNPFDDDELIPTIREFSYPEVGDFLENHVVNNTPIDYNYYLNKVGIQFGEKTVNSSYFIDEQQPLVKASEDSNEIIFESNTKYNNFLKNLGIQGGDVLLSINGKKYQVKNIYDLFGDSNQWKLGDTVIFEIKRGTEKMTLQTEVIKPTIQKTILEQIPDASEQQIKLLKSWIND